MKERLGNQAKAIFTSRYFNCGLRIAIGVILLMAGVGKLASGHELVNVVASLKMLPYPMVHPVGLILPVFEITLGILFLLGLFSRVAAAISLPLFAAFIVTNIFNLHSGITEPCSSCFGNFLVMTARDALIIDVLMLAAAFRLMMLEEYSISLDSLWTRRARPAEASR